MTVPVSIIVLTKNEEANLPELAASIPWCDDVHVVDSLSTDGTVVKAKELGFQTWSHPFRGFGDHAIGRWITAPSSILGFFSSMPTRKARRPSWPASPARSPPRRKAWPAFIAAGK